MKEKFRDKLRKLEIIAEKSRRIDKHFAIPRDEFVERRRQAWKAVRAKHSVDVAVAFSDEHYSGDVPYLGGNTNYSIEQVAFGLGPDPLRSGIIAGFEGVYVAGQLATRAGVPVYPTESLQLADEKYPVHGFSLPSILNVIAGKRVHRIGLLTPRQVIPDAMVSNLEQMVGPQNLMDVQEPYQRVKNLKSDNEMRLLEDAAYVSALALRTMLAVFEPGMDETEIAAFGDMLAKWMGCERKGFETIVGSDDACITMIGPALNRPVRASAKEAVFLHFGASYKRDGLTACCRRSAFSGEDNVTPYQDYFRDLVQQAFRVAFDAYVDIAEHEKPAKVAEQTLQDFFNTKTDEMLGVLQKAHGEEAAEAAREKLMEYVPGIVKGLARLKPYTGTHNAGYTECQEFYGAITTESEKPLDRQVVTMLDVALRGRGSRWIGGEFERILPGFDYWVVEDTLAKSGHWVKNLTGELQPRGKRSKGIGRIPVNVQSLLGNVREFSGR